MQHFELFAHGDAFDVDPYVAATTLPIAYIWHRGEGHYKTSGLSMRLGDGTSIGLLKQEQIAIEFLVQHRKALQDLAEQPGVETFILGLQYHVDLRTGVVGFCMGPSAQLMELCLKIGISPMFYVSLDRDYELNEVAQAWGLAYQKAHCQAPAPRKQRCRRQRRS
jgi:hypothetical protein